MALSLQRLSQPPAQQVDLHCAQCDSQIGRFDNEWRRLTPSYVCAAQPGKHFGTQVAANKAQVVPVGVSQQALEGCTLAEVFCAKCSGIVGQYCKAIPGPERKHMLKQYLYRLSRTYLRSRDMNERVDVIYVYSGDLVGAHTRTNHMPRPSLPPVPQWSQPRGRQEMATSGSQKVPGAHRRISAPTQLQMDDGLATPDELYYREHVPSMGLGSVEQDTKSNAHEARWATLDTGLRQNENHIRSISSILDAFCNTIETMSASIKELQTQNSMPYADPPAQIDVVANLRSMITALRSAQSNEREIEKLRAENAALKARWDIVQSAMAAAAEQPSPSHLSTRSHQTHLGKRKRDDGFGPSLAPGSTKLTSQLRAPWLEHASSSRQIPTPQSSCQSDLQSQDASNNSRTPSPEEEHSEADVQSSSQAHQRRRMPAQRLLVEASSRPLKKKPRLSRPDQSTKALSPYRRPASTLTLQPNAEAVISTLEAESGQDGPVCTPTDESPPVEEQQNGRNQVPVAANVDFSDEEDEGHHDVHEDPAVEQSEEEDPSFVVEGPIEDAGQGDATSNEDSERAVPARRTRSKTQVAAGPGAEEKAGDRKGRNTAPPESVLRKILPRPRIEDQSPVFDHSIAATIQSDSVEPDEQRTSMQRQRQLPSKTRQLHEELKELGLAEWIDRDKKGNPEYLKLVGAARRRKREQDSLAASQSVAAVAAAVNVAEAPHVEQTQAEATNEQVSPAQIPEKTLLAARRAAGLSNRHPKQSKAQRDEEIRRRDELAKAAMERND